MEREVFRRVPRAVHHRCIVAMTTMTITVKMTTPTTTTTSSALAPSHTESPLFGGLFEGEEGGRGREERERGRENTKKCECFQEQSLMLCAKKKKKKFCTLLLFFSLSLTFRFIQIAAQSFVH